MFDFTDAHFIDAELPEVNLYLALDDDVNGSYKILIRGPIHAAAFILSAHDRVRLIELLGGTDAT